MPHIWHCVSWYQFHCLPYTLVYYSVKLELQIWHSLVTDHVFLVSVVSVQNMEKTSVSDLVELAVQLWTMSEFDRDQLFGLVWSVSCTILDYIIFIVLQWDYEERERACFFPRVNQNYIRVGVFDSWFIEFANTLSCVDTSTWLCLCVHSSCDCLTHTFVTIITLITIPRSLIVNLIIFTWIALDVYYSMTGNVHESFICSHSNSWLRVGVTSGVAV